MLHALGLLCAAFKYLLYTIRLGLNAALRFARARLVCSVGTRNTISLLKIQYLLIYYYIISSLQVKSRAPFC